MSSKIDKEALKGPDVFVSASEHVFKFVEQHFKTFLGVLGVIAVVGVAYVTYGYMQSAAEQKAAEAIYRPEIELRKAEDSVIEAREKQAQGEKGKKAVEKPATVDYQATYSALVDKLAEQIRAHGDAKAALVSALNLSSFLIQQKQFTKALEILNSVKYRPSESDDLNGFWLMHRGLVFIENGQVDQALDSYQKVLAVANLRPFQPEAMLKLGLCYELKGDLNKARETYEKLGRDFPKSEASATAEQFLRLLELKGQKQG